MPKKKLSKNQLIQRRKNQTSNTPLRLPRNLHRKFKTRCNDLGISMNTYLVSLVASELVNPRIKSHLNKQVKQQEERLYNERW